MKESDLYTELRKYIPNDFKALCKQFPKMYTLSYEDMYFGDPKNPNISHPFIIIEFFDGWVAERFKNVSIKYELKFDLTLLQDIMFGYTHLDSRPGFNDRKVLSDTVLFCRLRIQSAILEFFEHHRPNLIHNYNGERSTTFRITFNKDGTVLK